MWGAIVAGLALIAGVIYYFKNKSKNDKPIAQSPEIPQQQYYQPQIYSQSNQINNTNPFFVKTNYNVNNDIFKNFIKT
ncbi:MAG: hypothetical protein PHV68_07170 [Candidatus Gastranaerophilales bacterium]|nr:hypothetical protein [Candidatus Gastranaerophilales bacterium]